MLLNSPLFLKAVSVISKQQHHSPAFSADSTNSVTASTSKGKKKDYSGRFLSLFLNHFNSFPLDLLTKFLNNSDIDHITRARDIVANSVMAEITREDPQGHTEFQDAVRHQIVALFQRLRLSLLVLDTLMEAYNASN